MLSAHRLSCLRNQQVLFAKLDFTVAPTEILHIGGPNGCGKSSLLQILLGLSLPSEGEVRWQGEPITSSNADYHASVAYLGHKIGVKNNLTVCENLQMAAQLAGRAFLPASWQTIAQRMGLQGLGHSLCQRLSAGQRQRVALARLLLGAAPLWILDEPFTSLDAQAVILLQNLLLDHCDAGGMVVITSHQPLLFAQQRLKQLVLR